MVDGFEPDDPEYDHDGERDDLAALDFAALDFSAPDESYEDSGLGALDEYVDEDPADTGPVLDALGAADAELDKPAVPLFTVTNPPGTVTVTTYMDGRVHRIDLLPKVTTMTERDLAEEIVVIAGLATADARSAQYSFMLDGMMEQGHDPATTRDFLTRDLALPTPEQAQAARADVFVTRYAGGHD